MKYPKVTMAILSGVLAFAIQGHGQTAYQLNVKATCFTTNDAGEIISQKINNKNFIQDAVTATGATNASSLSLVYVQGASSDPSVPGDFVEVVDKSGTPVYTNLLFLYGSPFPPALTNSSGTAIVAGAQVIPLPLAGSGDSLGGATIDERIMPKKVLIRGTFNYTMLRSPGSTANDIVRACSGSFSVNKVFTAK
jgi:hypothetical protein